MLLGFFEMNLASLIIILASSRSDVCWNESNMQTAYQSTGTVSLVYHQFMLVFPEFVQESRLRVCANHYISTCFNSCDLQYVCVTAP